MRAATSGLLLALGLAGCAPRGEERVSVDLATVARRARVVDPAVAPVPRSPAPLGAATRTLPALPATVIAPPKEVSKAELRARLERERAAAQASLAERLRDSYAAEAQAAEFAKLREIEAARLEGAQDVIARLRERFDAYNAKRAPLVARLAFLVGFPDPGARPTDAVTEASRRAAAEAATIRTRLAELDRDFDAYVKGLQDTAAAELAAQLAKLREEFAAARRDLESRAIREAREQVARVAAELDLRLGGGEPVALPAVPARSVTLPASEGLPRVDFTPASPPDRLTSRLRAELRIWSGLRRTRVVSPGPGVRDATAEFEKWRQNR